MSLITVSLKLRFCICKSYSHFFSKHICDLDIVLTRTVNSSTTNELVKLTMLWTTESRMLSAAVMTGALRVKFLFYFDLIINLWLLLLHMYMYYAWPYFRYRRSSADDNVETLLVPITFRWLLSAFVTRNFMEMHSDLKIQRLDD